MTIKTNLVCCTITGADSRTDPDKLMRLSEEFPFVEWGILVSQKHEGAERFPNGDWIKAFCAMAHHERARVAVHVCGAWVRALLVGEMAWSQIPEPLILLAERIQLNTHAEKHVSTKAMYANLEKIGRKEVVFQWDGVNDHLFWAARMGENVYASALFDTSGGAGRLPKKWPAAFPGVKTGYAGGLGPDNIKQQLPKIVEAAGDSRFWIDMENNVRTDGALDLGKTRDVLVAVKEMQFGE